MLVTHKINIYLDTAYREPPPIDVMQGDANTRNLEFSLYAGGKEWVVPDGVSVAVAYRGESGHGAYDTLPDGTAAYTVAGNVVAVTLIPQVTARAGKTIVTIVFTDNAGRQLATFGVLVSVKFNPFAGAGKPANYYNLREWASTPFRIDVIHTAESDLVTVDCYDTIRQEYEAGRQMVCCVETEDQQLLELPLVEVKGQPYVFRFGAVSGGVEWTVEISQGADGAANIRVSGRNVNCPLTVETITVGGGDNEPVAVTGLTLDLSTYNATVGGAFYINPVVAPSNATNKAVTWKSSAESIATVDGSGYVECVAEGDAVITCTTSDGGFTATCVVNVAAAESGGDDSGGTTGEKVQFSTLEKTAGLMGSSGSVTSLGNTYHVQFPYTEGMVVSTGTNHSWNTTNYPPMVVCDNGEYSIPNFELTDKTATINSKYAAQYIATLTGYSENAVVYASFLVGGTITDEATLTKMDNADIFYYIPGGES